MHPDEKEQLRTLLQDAQHWCQGAEARDAGGQPVAYNDVRATAWDLTGATCRLFGMRRARALFVTLDRHLHPRDAAGADQRDGEVAAMVALQTWNDAASTTHVELVARLESLPVRAAPGAAQGNGARCATALDAAAGSTE